jgi:proteasome assembly chaperone (PAC2) family protein
MPPSQLEIHARPRMREARMVMGLSGWMDGGDVSTGTIECLVERLDAKRLAEIRPEDFYLYSFPGSMEISSLFRPYTKIENGLIVEYQPPTNVFHYDADSRLVLFEGKEPHVRWREFAECVFAVASEFGVERIYFLGSVAGVVPHTREPRISSSVSDKALKAELQSYGVRFSNYEGPASIVTYMTSSAAARGVGMATLVAEIPAYIQGRNPRCIEAVVRHIAAMLQLQVPLDDFRAVSDAFERRVNRIVEKRSELSQLIRKLESDYDSELFDTQMGDLKAWLHQQGIRLD